MTEKSEQPLIRRARFYFEHHRTSRLQNDGIDLDLIQRGWLRYNASGRPELTERGVLAAAEARQQNKLRQNAHDTLAIRLAHRLQCRNRLVWVNKEFRIEVSGRYFYARPDVYSLVATRNPDRIRPIVHEVKVSRSDFLSDVASDKKRAMYWNLAERVYYVAPPNIILREEIPDGCGLMVETSTGNFNIVLKCKRRSVEIPSSVWMNLIMKDRYISNN